MLLGWEIVLLHSEITYICILHSRLEQVCVHRKIMQLRIISNCRQIGTKETYSRLQERMYRRNGEMRYAERGDCNPEITFNFLVFPKWTQYCSDAKTITFSYTSDLEVQMAERFPNKRKNIKPWSGFVAILWVTFSSIGKLLCNIRLKIWRVWEEMIALASEPYSVHFIKEKNLLEICNKRP